MNDDFVGDGWFVIIMIVEVALLCLFLKLMA